MYFCKPDAYCSWPCDKMPSLSQSPNKEEIKSNACLDRELVFNNEIIAWRKRH